MAKQSRQPRFFQNKTTQKGRQKSSPHSQKPLPKEPITLEIERLSHDGRGIAKLNGKTTFVTGALPNETVTARITEQKSKFNAAQTLDVIASSEQRTEPQCQHYQQCGGCELQHLDAKAQIAYKQSQALDQLSRIGHVTPLSIAAPLDASPWHYRRRARLSIYCPRAHSEPVIGFRRRNDKTLVAIQNCPVLMEGIEALITPLQSWLSETENPQAFGHIELIQPSAEPIETAVIVRYTRTIAEADLESLKDLCETQQAQLFLQSDKGLESLSRNELLSYTLEQDAIKLEFSPSDFTQINPAINQLMVQQALEWLNPTKEDNVLDLFCGLGNFSLPIAKRAASVTGIEGSEAMVERAAANAKINSIDNASFKKGNLNHPNLPLKNFNKVLLDPPRAGAQAVVESITKSANKPAEILYVSCDPATFARDAGILCSEGYQLEKWGVMNMFPHTTHVESMGLFVQQ